MVRWFLLGLFIYTFYRLWQRMTVAGSGKTPSRPPSLSGEMIACSGCGIYILKDVAIENDNRFYCSNECRRKT